MPRVKKSTISGNKTVITTESPIHLKKNHALNAIAKEILNSGLFKEKLNPNKKFQNALLTSCYAIGDEVCHVHNRNMTDDNYNKMCWDVINACGGVEKMEMNKMCTSNEENNKDLKYRIK